MKVTNHEGQIEIGFFFRKVKLAPQSGITIPRLELCTAILAVEMIVEARDVKFEDVTYFTGSKVVLG